MSEYCIENDFAAQREIAARAEQRAELIASRANKEVEFLQSIIRDIQFYAYQPENVRETIDQLK
jgi:hypothetical protein